MIKKFQRYISPPRGAAPAHPLDLKICTDKLEEEVIMPAKFHLLICSSFFFYEFSKVPCSYLHAKAPSSDLLYS